MHSQNKHVEGCEFKMITKLSTLNMTHEEWIEERRRGIGGSDAGAVIGLNPYKGAFEVYADKLNLMPNKPDNERMRLGRDLEEYVANRFKEVTNKRVHRENHIIYNSDYPFAFANVDRLIVGEKAGLECKTTNSMNLKRYKNGDYPDEYYCQCLHYMAVTGANKWYLAVLVLGVEFKIFEIIRDDAEIAALMNAEKDFWENNVQKQIPPSPTGADGDIIQSIYPRSNNDAVELLGFTEKLKRRDEVKELLNKLEAEKKQIEQEIKLFMGEAETAQCSTHKVTWRNMSRTTVDVNSLVADLLPNTDISAYCKTTNYRIFKIQEVE